ncbi:MAG: hypothetical protein GY853_13605 [PVC group bacterium]|nr:hypothetical protein [PVC group bacterium]
MATKRMLAKSICTSLRVSRLKSDTARLLFTWLIPHCDDDGRIQGEENYIKGLVFPLLKHKTSKVRSFLCDLSVNNLIIWYADISTGNKYIQILKWAKFQTFRSDRYQKSELPEYNPDKHEALGFGELQVAKCAPNYNYNIIEYNIREGVVTPDSNQNLFFEWFYFCYPRRTNKEQARKAFYKLKPDEELITEIMAAVARQIEVQWREPQYIPHPSTYLNGRRWEDEVIEYRQPKESEYV